MTELSLNCTVIYNQNIPQNSLVLYLPHKTRTYPAAACDNLFVCEQMLIENSAVFSQKTIITIYVKLVQKFPFINNNIQFTIFITHLIQQDTYNNNIKRDCDSIQ